MKSLIIRSCLNLYNFSYANVCLFSTCDCHIFPLDGTRCRSSDSIIIIYAFSSYNDGNWMGDTTPPPPPPPPPHTHTHTHTLRLKLDLNIAVNRSVQLHNYDLLLFSCMATRYYAIWPCDSYHFVLRFNADKYGASMTCLLIL